jgi:putative heme iron utilization protein
MAEPSPGALARRLLRSRSTATLATSLQGAPYASLVLVAVDHDATPILLLSRLAEHTKNLLADARVSLLFDGTEGLDDPLTGPRVTTLGRAEPSLEPRHRQRFLARHAGAVRYADFGDFGFYRVVVERAHLVAGFGRIHWIETGDLLGRVEPALAAREADIVEHMNADHADAVRLYATVLCGESDGAWQMFGCDAEGVDLRLGRRTARLDFQAPATTADEARNELIKLVKVAREQQRSARSPAVS